MGIFVKSAGEKSRRKRISSRKIYWTVFLILVVGASAGFFIYPSVWDKGVDWVNEQAGTTILPHFYKIPFHLGLDLRGGAHLIYEADFSDVAVENQMDSMEGVRDVIERRVNLFGVTEPVIQINKVGDRYRLIVELAGIKDTHQAIEMIGQTPFLDFREEKDQSETAHILAAQKEVIEKLNEGIEISKDEEFLLREDPYFKPTLLTGRYLEGAQMQFDQQTYQPQISLEFNSEGAEMFAELTKKNIGQRMAIYLDGEPISAPVVQEAITGGKAQITGNFSLEEAKALVQRLNAGALPVPIDLISQQTVGASLGQISLDRSLKAAMWGFLVVLLFMIFYYRLSGLMASFALIIYVILVLAVFKLIPVTLTLAGIAGFVLSIGMAVDANILIFERFKEELKKGKSLGGSIDEGYHRAWPAIRDGNISTIITCLILYVFATGLVKGFALTLGIGVVISMFSAIVITKSFLRLFVGGWLDGKRGIWG